jgi:uncharacterized lipoprotein YbaY
MSRGLAAYLLSLAAPAVVLSIACAAPSGPGPAAPEPAKTLLIKGALSYLARIALPPTSSAVVELREISGGEGVVVADQRLDLKGRQVPIPFELTVDRTKIVSGRRYGVRGSVFVDGQPRWVTETVPIEPTGSPLDLGTLLMKPFQAPAFDTTYRCGDQSVRVGVEQETMRLAVGNDTFDLRQVPAASGAKYEAVADPSTSFWSKGDRAMLVVKGRAYPECSKERGAPAAGGVSRATGNEPTWRLEIGNGLSVSPPATTMKACAPALMGQEAVFLEILRNTQRFELKPDGALVLHASDRRTITARRG